MSAQPPLKPVQISAHIDLAADALRTQFEHSRAAFHARGVAPTCAERIDALRKLETALYTHRHELAAAVSADFSGCADIDDRADLSVCADINGRAVAETLLLEIFGLLDEIRHTRKQLSRWMRPRRVPTNALFRPSRSRVLHQPLGVVGIIGAFNYPLLLTLSPLIGALAAGNHVILKPSELAPRSGALLRELLGALFATEYVAVVSGDADLARKFSALPFDHLLFTGSARVGREILRSAAANLTPVTLELGGKSPAIIGPDYSLQHAVTDICYAKFLNAGQTCVAPDYVLVPEAQRDEFIRLAGKTIAANYPTLVANRDYTRLINTREHQRLTQWLDDAIARGAHSVQINPARENCDTATQVFAPTLVWDCPDDCALLQQEIFGPILPVIGYRDLDTALARVNAAPRPLALYYFDNNRARIDHVLARTLSGGVTVNGCVYHVGQHALPFGGVGASGMGQYHGFDGFETFSKKRAVFETSRLMSSALLRPPFGKGFEWLIGTLLRGKPQRERLDSYRTK